VSVFGNDREAVAASVFSTLAWSRDKVSVENCDMISGLYLTRPRLVIHVDHGISRRLGGHPLRCPVIVTATKVYDS
jgi:hypothetical protein